MPTSKLITNVENTGFKRGAQGLLEYSGEIGDGIRCECASATSINNDNLCILCVYLYVS